MRKDVVIAGADRNEIGVADLPDPRRLPTPRRDRTADIAASGCPRSPQRDRRAARAADQLCQAAATGSSNRVCRAHPADEPPSLDAGEITDKGSINQRAVLRQRAGLVDELYATGRPPRVIVIEQGA